MEAVKVASAEEAMGAYGARRVRPPGGRVRSPAENCAVAPARVGEGAGPQPFLPVPAADRARTAPLLRWAQTILAPTGPVLHGRGIMLAPGSFPRSHFSMAGIRSLPSKAATHQDGAE